MRFVSTLFAGLVCLLSAPAFACKEMVRYPEHLEGIQERPGSYNLIVVQSVDDQGVSGIVERSFHGDYAVGQAVSAGFKPNEEAHAICPVHFLVGVTYLIYSENAAGSMQISRFNWLNIPSSHPRFETYVQDVVQSQHR